MFCTLVCVCALYNSVFYPRSVPDIQGWGYDHGACYIMGYQLPTCFSILEVESIHISIVSRYLATRGNNKIPRRPPPHINSEQINPPFSNHTYTKSMPKHIHHHYAPSVTLTYITHCLNFTHIRTTLLPLDVWTDPYGVTALLPRWTEKMACGPQARRLDSPPPPTSKVHGTG